MPSLIDLSHSRLLSTSEVKILTGLKKTTLYELRKQGTFPRPVKQGRLSYYWEHEVLAYMEGLPRG